MNKKIYLFIFMSLGFVFQLTAQSETKKDIKKIEKVEKEKTEQSNETSQSEKEELIEREKAKNQASSTTRSFAPEDIGLFSDHGINVISGGEGKLVLENGNDQLRFDTYDIQVFNTSTDEYTGTLYINDSGGDVRISSNQLVVPQTGTIQLNDNAEISGSLGVGGPLDADAGLTVGDYLNTPINGTIRYSSADFQGYKDGAWTSLTNEASPWDDSTNGISYNNVEIHDSGTSGRIDFASSSHVYQLSPEGATFTMRDDNTYKWGYYGPEEVGPTTNNDMTLGSSTFRWMEIWSNNPLNTSSDKRMKKEIKPLEYGLNEILQLNPVQYKWIEGHDREMIGLIAQDVETIIPQVVGHHVLTEEQIEEIESNGGGRTVTEQQKDTYSMSYSQLIPVLINSVKELSAEVELLKQELSELKE